MVKISLEDRFWNKVDKTPYGITDSCWVWIGRKEPKKGYGEFSISHNAHRPAHRQSFMMTHNRFDLSRWDFVCHHCDNPSCVNPNHLFIGTPQENVDDMIQKGRQAKGEKSISNRILSDDNVRAIRKELSNDTKWGNRKRIGNIYNVTGHIISDIANGKKWKHIN